METILTLDGLLSLDNMGALLTLTMLEIVLNIDNVIFIAILCDKLPAAKRDRVRTIGMLLAGGVRILLLMLIKWIMTLEDDLFTAFGTGFSGRDLILLGGGLFLVGKATFEIHDNIETTDHGHGPKHIGHTFAMVLAQILALDIVFSLDSIITAVGMAKDLRVMIAAIVIAVGVMVWFAGPVSRFVERHPTMRMLALAFLVLIGVLLVADSFDHEIPRGYVYFAMAFAFVVELLNIRAGRSSGQQPQAAPPTANGT